MPGDKLVNFRLLRAEETEAVAALARDVFDEFVAPGYSPEGREEFHRYAESNALALRNREDHVTWVADANGALVGMLQLRQGQHIAMLFVRAPQQRQGVGLGLVRAAWQHARRRGEAADVLTVNSSPNAVLAYRRFGFVPAGPEQCTRGLRFVPMKCSRLLESTSGLSG